MPIWDKRPASRFRDAKKKGEGRGERVGKKRAASEKAKVRAMQIARAIGARSDDGSSITAERTMRGPQRPARSVTQPVRGRELTLNSKCQRRTRAGAELSWELSLPLDARRNSGFVQKLTILMLRSGILRRNLKEGPD